MLEAIFSGTLGTALVVVGIILVITIGITAMWKKVPQDKALVVTGLKKRVISGGGGMVIPLFERADVISLESMQIIVNVKGLTSAGVDIEVGALTIIKIKNVEEKILAAMEQFNTGNIDGTIENITQTSREVLEGKLREILAGMTVEEIFQNRDKFASSVQEVAAQELEDMGLEIKAFTIKEIKDTQGYLDSLGKKQVAEVKKAASIAESNARKEQEITIAENDRETAIKTAALRKETTIQLAIAKQEEEKAQAEADIEIANAIREKELIELSNRETTERKRAAADAAYQIESNRVNKEVIGTQMDAQLVQEAKNVELTVAQMEVQRTREEQETVVATQKALRRQEELSSEVQKVAEAESQRTKTLADAELYKRTKEAEAKKLEQIKQAEAEAEKKKLDAIAQAEKQKVEAEAQAQATRAMGEADAAKEQALAAAEAKGIELRGLAEATAQKARASAIEAEGLAEAKVIREKALAEAEAKEKLAEAYQKYGDAAKMEMMIKVLPEITKSISEAMAEPISKMGNVTIVDTGSGGGGINKMTDLSTEFLAKVPAAIKATSGIDLMSILSNMMGGDSKTKGICDMLDDSTKSEK